MPREADPIRLSLARLIGRTCDRFEQDWQADQQPRLEDYLDGVEGAERAELLWALLRTELELRCRQAALDAPGAHPYRGR